MVYEKFYIIKRPSGKYHVRYFADGEQKMVSTKTKNKSDALQFLQDFKTKILNQHSNILLSELFHKYLTISAVDSAEKSKANYKTVVNSFIAHFGDKEIKEYTALQFDRYLSGMMKDRSPYTVHMHLRCLSTLFNRAIDWGFINKNPIRSRVKLPELEPRFYTKEQFNSLIKAIDEYSSNGLENKYNEGRWKQYYKDLFTFAVYSGLRFNELRHLKPENVVIDKKLIQVLSSSRHQTKGKKTRFVELHPLLIPIYERYKDKEYIFTSFEGKMINSDRVTKQLKKFSGIDRDFQDFRSTFGMWLLNAGNSLEYVSAQLGHKSISTTQKHYAKYITTSYSGNIEKI